MPEVYVYFKNDAFGYAIENAVTLRGILREAGEEVARGLVDNAALFG